MTSHDFIIQFNDNPEISFFINLGLIVMTVLAGFEAYRLINAYRFRPKISFKTEIEFKEKNTQTMVNFWILAENKGKGQAIQSRCILQFLDKTGTKGVVEKLSRISQKTSFNVLWHEAEELREALDILSKGSEGVIKVPFRLMIGKQLQELNAGESFSSVNSSFESPVERLDLAALMGQPVDLKHLANFRIELTIIYNQNKTVKKQFLLKIPWQNDKYGNSMAYINEIKFDPVNE